MKLDSSIAAVVTGGASGLGEATARALASQGVKVAIFDINESRGNQVAGEIGGVFCKVDVMSDPGVEAGFAQAREAHGQERILVNCAGSGYPHKTIARDKKTGEIKPFPSDAFAWVLMLNTVGSFRCITRAAAGMAAMEPLENGERGVIISTASVAAEDGQIGQAAYTASKAAITGMTLPIARDLSSEGIRVNTILPGTFNTPLMLSTAEVVRAGLAASVPFPKRLGEPPEYASLVLEIARNGYLNGECIRLDGAIRMAPR
ncbi:SDR family NAD(P)-dependent oxidoreductase [Solimonas sp. K1W22B-7]|uniref:SDR family NAD(P)-dependent oxidoreductase n=1 Tax=Solimonas sp. K1W22B-7 TaxID=2303331 RepID=UPI000E33503F|nr:SDR family NAD(P)-dependent oxidoreductase [Solimonas sp. K1W22B-7]AXQ30600.1 SDR family NAD(P)-dependent oxidoreductase [Solimonas sp. K1W22B-7]